MSRSAQRSISTAFRRLVEQYTPDRTTGRVGLAAVTGPIGAYSLMIAFGFLVNPWIGSVLLVPLAAVVGVFLTTVTILALWPVYLAAIGRLDSPADYPRDRDRQPRQNAEPSTTERLKRQYQRGDLTEAEFERELEVLLEDGKRSSRETEWTNRATEQVVTDSERTT